MLQCSYPALLPLLLLLCFISSPPVARAQPGTLQCSAWSPPGSCQWHEDTDTFEIDCMPGKVGAVVSSDFYYHGVFSADIKLQGGDTRSTCTAFYLISEGSESNADPGHFEIDIEFWGQETSDHIVVATNVFFGGKQNLAQFDLKFDASKEFHKYTIAWNRDYVVWLIDNNPIRVLSKALSGGHWPMKALKPHMTQWVTNFGQVKFDTSKGAVAAFGRNFQFSGCGSKSSDTKAFGDCPNWTGTELPWNMWLNDALWNNLSKTNYGAIDYSDKIADYGWDNA